MNQPLLPATLWQLLNSRPQPLCNNATEYLAQHLMHKALPAKTILQKTGQVATHIYFIETGLLHATQLINGKAQTIWFMQQGQVAIAIESFFTQQPAYHTIEAIEPCELYYITHAQYEALCTASPSFCNTARKLTEAYYCLAEHRNRLMRTGTPEQRLKALEAEIDDISLRSPLKHIASYLSIAQATLSRVRGKRAAII
ncbi:MAG: Crp/Fnr family transcriptional regulator [Bacteroidetes bacterium]|nr:MAG: Crp/Fnr family transcriptional regulator [Bacteroidota bacterium]